VVGKEYRYTDATTGAEHVRNMQMLAQAGQGLASYVSKFVHDDFEREH